MLDYDVIRLDNPCIQLLAAILATFKSSDIRLVNLNLFVFKRFSSRVYGRPRVINVNYEKIELHSKAAPHNKCDAPEKSL
jgi:hypothetical protein